MLRKIGLVWVATRLNNIYHCRIAYALLANLSPAQDAELSTLPGPAHHRIYHTVIWGDPCRGMLPMFRLKKMRERRYLNFGFTGQSLENVMIASVCGVGGHKQMCYLPALIQYILPSFNLLRQLVAGHDIPHSWV